MTLQTKVSGTWRDVPRVQTKVSGVWKEVISIYTKVSGVWKLAYSAITISGVPASKTSDSSGVEFYGPNGSSASGHNISFTVSGGTSPYTFALSKVSGNSNFFISAPGPYDYTSANGVAAANIGGSDVTGVVLLTVTDANGATGTASCTLTIPHA